MKLKPKFTRHIRIGLLFVGHPNIQSDGLSTRLGCTPVCGFHDPTATTGRRARARARKMKEAINALEQKLGRAATSEEICASLELTPQEYAKWLEESRPVTFIAIDQNADGEESEGASLHELLADESDVTGREKIEKQELLQLLTQRISELPDIPKKILAMYYFENMRLAEIAAVFSLTESRICQIHSQTIIGLRAYLSRVRNR